MSRRLIILPMLILTAACSDDLVSPESSLGQPDMSPFAYITGTVISENEIRSLHDESVIHLTGPQTALLGGLVGAEIRVLGTPDVAGADEAVAQSPLWVIEFRVLSVDGLPALDGKFAQSEDGFGIDTGEGSITYVEAVPEELRPHVGDRVWLTTYQGRCIRFGVLEMER